MNTFARRGLSLSLLLASLPWSMSVVGQAWDDFPEATADTNPTEAGEGTAIAGDRELVDRDGDGEQDLPFGLGWLDETQAYASVRANTLADQIDRFFGVPRTDLEAAYSSLRLTWVNRISDIEGFETDLRLRGKLHLPRIDERVSLVFSEDEGDGTSYYQQPGATDSASRDTKVNLEYNFLDTLRNRLDFRLGMSSGLKPRGSVRYRYEAPFAENYAHRITQTAYYKTGDGFGSVSRYDLERSFGDHGLLRWSSDARFEESYTGAEWSTGLSYARRLSADTGVIYYARIGGLTHPDLVTAQDIGIRIRRNVYRPWLFVEIEPGYTWQKEDRQSSRESSPFLFLRFEMAIGKMED